MQNIMIAAICIFSMGVTTYARTGISLPQKDSKIFVTSSEMNTIPYGNKDIGNWGYWKTVDDKSNADFIIDYKVEKTWTISFLSRNLKGYAQIINAKTGEVVYTSRRANSYWSFWGPNHKNTIIRKLDRKIKKRVD